MPALNFKSQFADDVESGRKRQTIRKRRKRPIKVGDPLYLYTGMRTKHCRMLRAHPETCTSVEPIVIRSMDGVCVAVSVGGRLLNREGAETIARADGFTSLDEFGAFFERQYGASTFEGVLLKW